MIFPDVFFSFCVALVLAMLFAFILTRDVPRNSFFWLFLVIFLATWAGGIWGKPYGAALWGRNLLPFLVAGILAAVLFGILAPKRSGKKGGVYNRKETIEMIEEAEQRKEMKKVAYITLNVFFWFIIASLLSVILLRYLWG